MTRAELIRLFVLDSFCDDYEDIEQITKSIDRNSHDCGMTISHDEIIQALRELVEIGYAKAWDFDPREREKPEQYAGLPSTEEIAAGACFKGTPEGLEFYKSHSFPAPFYWNGKLHQDWIPPNEPISILLLASIWDGYTTFEFIQMRMDDLARRLKTDFSRDEILTTLRKLTDLGYLKAWRLDQGDPPREYEGMPPLEHIRPYRAYFEITPSGMEVQRANYPGWPFDDNQKIRKGWSPPDNV